jgi:hypothetical protein
VGEEGGGRLLLVREGLFPAVRAAGLGECETWERALRATPEGPGRGAIARLALPGGPRVVLKRMRRGGVAGPLWRDRFAGRARLVANLEVPVAAAARGVPTAAPVALLLVEGPSSLARAWLAVEEIEGALDLETRLLAGSASRDDLAAALVVVRKSHDAGLFHPDLNLGNLLVRTAPGLAPEAFLVDLDRARLEDRPLSFGRRRAALRRLERSCLKKLGRQGPLGADAGDLLRSLYAAGDEALALRLRATRGLDRLLVAAHRAGSR